MPPTTTYVVSDQLVKASSLLPSNKNRSFIVHSLIKSLGLLHRNNVRVVNPKPAGLEELSVFHDKSFCEHILGSSHSEPSEEYGLEDDCPPFKGLDIYASTVAGASITAAKCLTSGTADFAIAWDGGRHHAQKSRAAGFCYVNDCVLAILHLRKPVPSKPRPKVLYIDLDLHFGDGVSHAFSSSQQSGKSGIMTISIHHSSPGFYPPSPALSLENPYNISVPLDTGASEASFARLWPMICRIKEAFDPQYVVVQCGVDGLSGDPCKVWNWGLFPEGSGRNPPESETVPLDGALNLPRVIDGSFISVVTDIVQNWNSKTLFLGGGGYHSANAARAWAALTSVITGDVLPPTTPIPSSIPPTHVPLYGPSFTLDVPSGFARDTNFVASDSEKQVPTEEFANTLSRLEAIANLLEEKRMENEIQP